MIIVLLDTVELEWLMYMELWAQIHAEKHFYQANEFLRRAVTLVSHPGENLKVVNPRELHFMI